MTPAERSRVIVAQVLAAADITPAQLRGETRSETVVEARARAAWVLRRLTGQSLPAIGRVVNRHHSTICHHLRRVDERRAADADYRAALDQLAAHIMETL